MEARPRQSTLTEMAAGLSPRERIGRSLRLSSSWIAERNAGTPSGALEHPLSDTVSGSSPEGAARTRPLPSNSASAIASGYLTTVSHRKGDDRLDTVSGTRVHWRVQPFGLRIAPGLQRGEPRHP